LSVNKGLQRRKGKEKRKRKKDNIGGVGRAPLTH
jgi:hypothetical protein